MQTSTKTVKRIRAAKTSRRRSNLQPETIELARRLARAHDHGETVDPSDRAQLRIEVTIAGSEFLQSLVGDDDLGAFVRRISSDAAWSNTAATTLALILTGRLEVADMTKDRLVELLELFGVDLPAVAASGSWFPENGSA